MLIGRAGWFVTLVVLVVASAAPALAESEHVYVGVYSDQWDAELDIRNLGVVGERQVTFGGTFHRPDEGRSNTLHILESFWRAESTAVANLEIFSSSADIAAGRRDASIVEWATSVQAWLSRSEGRSLLIAPLAEMNGSWVLWGMDPVTYPTPFAGSSRSFATWGWTRPGSVGSGHPTTSPRGLSP